MSERAEFLCKYAEGILGRVLTTDEAEKVSAEVNRRVVSDLCATFSAPKSKPKAKKASFPKKIEKVIDEVVENEE